MSQSETSCQVHALDHLVLTVADIDATLEFYAQTLGMRGEAFEIADGSKRWALFFGQAKINLHQKGREFDPKARHPKPGSADLCFLSRTPITEWQAHLGALGIPVEEGPVARTGATGPIMSVYIRDPDQNLVEIGVPG